MQWLHRCGSMEKSFFLFFLLSYIKEITVLYLQICQYQLLIWWLQIELTGDELAEKVKVIFATIKLQLMSTNRQLQ
jgi:hypothetical protein